MVLLDFRVALDDMDVDLAEKALLLGQDVIGFRQEGLHQLSLNGAGGVDGNDEILDFFDLLVLQRLDEGHVLIELEAVGIKDVVKFVVVDLHVLPQDGKFPQEVRIVVFLPVDLLDILQKVRGPVPPGGLGGGLQIHLHPLADGLPLGLKAAARRSILCSIRRSTR